ncbi:MAG: cytochrome c oxidase accessory protein CcoG [Rhizobiaceae bacterium]
MLNEQEIERVEVEAVNAAKTRQPLYQRRKKVFPKRASGDFRRFKWIVMAITLGIYYVTPWLRWDRGPYAPDQGVLIDFPARRFYFFPIEIWPQEFFFVAGLLVMGGVGLFLITSIVGRAWCGYTCWQTVWTDLFLVVERFVEGDRNARIALDKAPWGLSKLGKRVVKNVLWLFIAMATGGAWIFYFADAPTLLMNFLTFQAPSVAYITVGVLTATTFVFAGYMREQVCIYMCPWPRIQAAMLDEESLVVTYNDWRGEPRTRGTKKAAAAGIHGGDCVDCNACVVVCPQGIDIRDGQQLECITCALCIDACDAVMDKLGKPRGLISYATLSEYNENMKLATNNGAEPINPGNIYTEDGKLSPKVQLFRIKHLFRPRTFVYMGVWSAIGVALLVALFSRDRLELNVLHDRNPQFVTLSSGAVRNAYTVKILNMIPEERTFMLSMTGLAGATMSAVGFEDQLAGDSLAIPVEPDKLRQIRLFVEMPAGMAKARSQEFVFEVVDKPSGEVDRYTATFFAPEPAK